MVDSSNLLQQIITILERKEETKVRYSLEIRRFKETKQSNENDKFRLGVIGVTSSGKSTMINSFLGEALLPAVAKPSSSQLVTCYKDSQRCATVFFENSTSKFFSGNQLTPSIISHYGDENSNSQNKEHVKQIEIKTPNFPFDKSLVLIDSPGLDAFGFEGHEKLTMHSLLPTIDFALFITTFKTNSDEKMRNVLNVIAEYEKPVIVIQNMIDSIQPSVDGKKSIEDVALDHKRRIERVVKESKIKDKSKVYVIQISAKWALEAREGKAKGIDTTKKLKDSNYEYLIDSIKRIFSLVKPNVDANRIRLLKKDIDKIIEDAEKDCNVESLKSVTFEFTGTKNELTRKYNNCSNSIVSEISKLSSKKNEISYSNLSQGDLDGITLFVSSIENNVISKMKAYYKEIEKDCERLNVDVRNYTMGFQTSDFGSLNIKEEIYKKRTKVFDGYEYVPKAGVGNKFKRGLGSIFGKEEWGCEEKEKYKYVTETLKRTDYEGTRERAVDYLSKAEITFNRTLSSWGRTIENINRALFAVVDTKEEEFNNRKKLALKSEVYKELVKELRVLSSSINVNTTQNDVVHTDDNIGVHKSYSDITVSKQTYNLAKLAQVYGIKMQQAVIASISDSSKQNIIVGWDNSSESWFLKRSYGLSVDYNSISEGINKSSDIILVHKPTLESILRAKESKPSNIYVLVNATQFGSALTQIASCNLNKVINGSDNTYFIIQDFSEIINAHAVDETIKNMKSLGKNIGFNFNYKILLNHENPIYNMAAAEVQVNPCKLQSDEVTLLNEFQKKYNYLLKGNSNISNILQSIIKNLSSK